MGFCNGFRGSLGGFKGFSMHFMAFQEVSMKFWDFVVSPVNFRGILKGPRGIARRFRAYGIHRLSSEFYFFFFNLC